MTDDFGAVLRGLRRLFPPALIGASGWERLLAVADQLPASVIDYRFGFEFALADARPLADFCVVPTPGSPLADHYARLGRAAASGSAAAALGAFLEQMCDPESYLARTDTGIILEYDLAAAAPGLAGPPGIFLVPRTSAGGVEDGKVRGLRGVPDALAGALCAAAGRTGDPAELRRIAAVIDALEGSAHVAQAGIMPGRAPRAVRLIIKGVEFAGIPALLERLQWPGAPAQAAQILDRMAGLVYRAAVSIDVTARGVAPRLGLELFRQVEWFHLDRAGWTAFIDRLEALEWCVPPKAAGLRAWPRLEHAFGEAGPYRVHQSLNHVKIVLDDDRVSAQAYAGMAITPFAPQPPSPTA